MISILIPSYNHAKYVVAAIDSARQIDLPARKIYVIDDFSKDDSAVVIKNHLNNIADENIYFIEKSTNKGVVDSVLMFISLCNTEYVYLMASDDVAIAPGIQELVRRMEISQELKFIIGGGEVFSSRGNISSVYNEEHEHFFNLDKNSLIESLFLNYPSPILAQSSVFRLSSICEVKGFDRAVVADDFFLFTRLFLKFNRRGIDFDFFPDINCVRYRQHEENNSLNILRQVHTTNQVLKMLAPDELKSKAIGKKISYYALLALKSNDWKAILGISRILKPIEFYWFVYGIFMNLNSYIARIVHKKVRLRGGVR